MKNKKYLQVISFFFAVGIIVASLVIMNNNKSKNNSEVKPLLVTMVLDLGGPNDQSFNETALVGAENAAREYGIEFKYLESNKEGDYATNIETAIDMDSDLIVGVGFNLSSAINDAALAYPEQNFAIIDGSFETIPSNVKTLTFNESDAGYLVGLAAAKKSNSNNFGFIGGLEVPAVVNFKNGFEKGIQEVNPNAKLHVQYANSFVDAAKGKAIAQSMYQNMDIIMASAGGCNQGIYEAAIENNKYAIAVDTSQSYIAPDFILTSALKNVDVAVQSTIKEVVDGKFKGGEASVYDLANGGVGYEQTHLLGNDIITFIEDKKSSLK